MKRALLLTLFLAGCRLYDPTPVDCHILCGVGASCPFGTSCRAGFCRVSGAAGPCECVDGDERVCGSALGVCQPGTQRCAGTTWGPCEGGVQPGAERCNGVDDDCNGAVDDEVPLAPSCELIFGACLDSRKRCVGGAWQPCDAQRYGPTYEPTEVSCDGVDNDCDGRVDSEAPVLLASGVSGPWFLLTTARGFALVSTTDAGVDLRWLTTRLEERGRAETGASSAIWAGAADDALLLVENTPGGVLVRRFEVDAGVTGALLADWPSVEALQVAGETAAAQLDGSVQLRSLVDGGAPLVLGPSTAAPLRLSQTGNTLAWTGGLHRTTNLEALTTTSPGPLLALLELDTTRLAGVPLTQPVSGRLVFFDDLFRGPVAVPINPFPIPVLSSLWATEHRGRVFLVGLEDSSRLWLVSEGGTLSLTQPGPVSRVRATPSHSPFAALAWQRNDEVWGLRRCAP